VGEVIDLTLATDEFFHEIEDNNLSVDEWKSRLASDPSLSRTVTASVTGVVLPAAEVAADDQDRPPTLWSHPRSDRHSGCPT